MADHGDGSSTSFINIITGKDSFVQVDVIQTPYSEATAINVPDSPYADGVYTATGKGIGGNVPVTVTIANGSISEVSVGNNGETHGVGTKAIEQLPSAIVAANGTDGVSSVSGATVTSGAIFAAVNSCLSQASDAKANAPATPEPDSYSLLDIVVESLGKQDEDTPAASSASGMETKATTSVSFKYPDSCTEQKMAFDQLYLFDGDRTLQTYVEPYGGPQKEVSSIYDDASLWSNLFTYSGEYDPSAAEWPADYAQQFASSHNGWVLSSGSTEVGTTTASTFAIRAEIETGTVIYAIAVVPHESGHPTIITTRCPLNFAQKWNAAINEMLGGLETAEPNGSRSWQLSSQPDWHILIPGDFSICDQTIEVYHYNIAWMAESRVLVIGQDESIARYGTYYPFGVAGDNVPDSMYIANQWDEDIPSGSVRFTEVHEYDDPDATSLLVDTHSGTDNCMYLYFLFLHPDDREFNMPTINAITSSITFE